MGSKAEANNGKYKNSNFHARILPNPILTRQTTDQDSVSLGCTEFFMQLFEIL